MFRLMALLCAGIYVAMLTLGQDNGQLRFGLMQAKSEKAAQMAKAVPAAAPAPVEPAPKAAPVVATAFVPAKPLIATPETAAPVEGKLAYVASESVNVREGPGKAHAVIERLPQGEAVLVLQEGKGPDGWSLIRIEGDGVEGYVASRLLRE